MKSILICVLYIACGFDLINAQEDIRIIPINNLPVENGPEFHANKNGLILSASFPKWIKDLSSLEVQLELGNRTGRNLLFKFDTSLRGFGLRFTDISQNEIPITDRHKRLREGGLGFQTLNLSSGSALVMVVQLSQFYKLDKMDKCKFKVSWRDLKLGHLGYVPEPNPEVEVEGTIVLHQNTDGISISADK